MGQASEDRRHVYQLLLGASIQEHSMLGAGHDVHFFRLGSVGVGQKKWIDHHRNGHSACREYLVHQSVFN